jgi:hypothetical protein
MSGQMLPQRLNQPASTMGVWGLVGVLLVAAVLAVLFGLIAVTASPILVSLAAAMLVGFFLLAKPTWNIWFVLVLGLLVAGVIPIWADSLASKAVWGISILGFMLLGSALFSAASNQGAIRNTPGFVWITLIFILYTVFTTLIQFHSVGEFLGGFKRYFQVVGLLFALVWLPFQDKDIQRWRKFFLVVALFQLPWAVYELVRLVPLREGFRHLYPGLVPVDVIAGTFGANMTGGGANAEMATFLIVILAFLLAHLREKQVRFGKTILLLPFLVAPLLMGETKAVVVLLPIMFLTLYRRELLARPHYAIAGLLAGALLTVAAGYAYLQITKKTLDQQVAETLSYNVYEGGYGGNILNRTTVLTFWAEQQGLRNPVGAVLGNGLGSANDRTGGETSRRYPGYGIGLTAASTLLWEQGVVGTTLFLAILAFAWRAAMRVRRAEAAPLWARADAAAIQAVLPLFAFYLIYRSAMLDGLPFQIVFYCLLGYLAWLAKRFAAGKRS